MKKNIFTVSGFSVSGFCRSKARRRVIACVALFGMLVTGAIPALALNPGDGTVFAGNAAISGTVGTSTIIDQTNKNTILH